MIRKQLYITEAQERALKRRAHEEGRSEAEVARQALAAHLRPAGARRPGAPTEASRKEALAELIETTRQLAEGRRLSDDFRQRYREMGRAAFYEERMRRLDSQRGGGEAPGTKGKAKNDPQPS